MTDPRAEHVRECLNGDVPLTRELVRALLSAHDEAAEADRRAEAAWRILDEALSHQEHPVVRAAKRALEGLPAT